MANLFPFATLNHASYRLHTPETHRLRSLVFQVRAIASYGSQVNVLRGEGFQANTLAAFLASKDKGIDGRSVLEAGAVPARLMERFLRTAQEAGARVVQLGDTAQTKAIEAGRPFDQLQAAGMRTALMDEIQRQRDPELRHAVRLAAFGDTDAAFTKLRSVQEFKDDQERREAIVTDYMALSPAERNKALILAITNEARFELNRRVCEATGLEGKGRTYDALIRHDTTQAEHHYARNYYLGDLIQPEKDYPLAWPGARGSLPGAGERSRQSTPPRRRRRIAARGLAGEPEEALGLRAGPAGIRHRRHRPDHPQRSGAGCDQRRSVPCHRIDRVARTVTIEDGKRQVVLDSSKPLHLDHAYSMTVHGAQGATADRVLFEADTRPRTLAPDVFYVGISRPRIEARIYTDDIGKLPEAIRLDTVKHAAMDLVRAGTERQVVREHVRGPERQRDEGFQR
jgi:ATP-dependent exoDNAse (exonuclease V) alpha subunit